MRDLKDCRIEIDRIDHEILRLVKERLLVADDIAEYKIAHNQDIVDKTRESQKLAELIKLGHQEGISSLMVLDLFKTLMSHTVSHEQSYILEKLKNSSLQRDTSIAYLGKQIGTYSHLAASLYTGNFKGRVRMAGCESFQEIIAMVEQGHTEYAIVPIENSSSGSINEVLDLISNTNAYLTGELFLPIDHSILGIKEVPLHEITDLYSHPQPVSQCSDFIAKALGHAKIHYVSSTSEAMAQVAQLQDPKAAAIASRDSAHLFNLISLKQDIANHKNNYTRFVVLSLIPVTVPEGLKAKTSLIFSVKKYQPGSLVAVLNAFYREGINLTKLHSRPRESSSGEIWEEIFFADVEANLNSPKMQKILDSLKSITEYLKVLGCYLNSDRPNR